MCVLRSTLWLGFTFVVAPSKPSKHPARTRGLVIPDQHPPSPTIGSLASSMGIPASTSSSSSGSAGSAGSQPTLLAPLGLYAAAGREKARVAQPEEQTDNWDDDFEEGISLTKIQGVLFPESCGVCIMRHIALEKTTSEDDTVKQETVADENARTIRPTKSPSKSANGLPAAQQLGQIDEDWSDLAGDDDDLLAEKVADFKVNEVAAVHKVPILTHTLLADEEFLPQGLVPPERHQDRRARPPGCAHDRAAARLHLGIRLGQATHTCAPALARAAHAANSVARAGPHVRAVVLAARACIRELAWPVDVDRWAVWVGWEGDGVWEVCGGR